MHLFLGDQIMLTPSGDWQGVMNAAILQECGVV